MNNYGYQQYKEQSVNTMTGGEMLLLLFDEAIKRLTRAEIALEKKNYTLFNESVTRTQEIFRYLIETLDRRYAISNELSRLYDFFLFELSRLSAGRNPEIVKELKPLVLDLRNTFKEADKLSVCK